MEDPILWKLDLMSLPWYGNEVSDIVICPFSYWSIIGLWALRRQTSQSSAARAAFFMSPAVEHEHEL